MQANILIVDDEPADLLAFSAGLAERDRGLQVDTVATAEEAMEILRSKLYNVVLSDIRLPGMDGVSFLRELNQSTPEMPVVLVTGVAADRQLEAKREGVFAFIEKPVDLDELVAVIRQALVSSQLRQEVRRRNTKSMQDYEAQKGRPADN
jgi:DNA-binding NtrC family response regulator